VSLRRLFSILAIASGISIGEAVAQTEAADYARIGYAGFISTVASDYQCVGINPANLGFIPSTEIFDLSTPMQPGVEIKRRNFAFTVAEGGVSLHSDALDRSGLLDMITQTSSGSFSAEDKRNAARSFIDKGVRFNIDMIVFAASAQSQEYGGVAFTWRERIGGTYLFNESASRLAFEGRYFDYFDSSYVTFNGDTVGVSTDPKNYSELFDGTRLSTVWFRELGLSYGYRVRDGEDLDLYLGFGAKYLLGYAYVDAFVENGALKAASSLSPFFGISYGKVTSPSLLPGNDFEPVGRGWSIDLGATLTYEKWSFALSIIDLGRMTWDGNVFTAKDTILNGVSSTGFESFNIFEEAPKITGDGNFFKWEGLAAASSDLPARLRLGISHVYDKHWSFGIDAVFPVNEASGALGEPIATAGADYRPNTWFRVGFGLGGGGNMGAFLPVSVLFSLFDNRWELGLSSRDVITYVIGDRPILSAVIGVARVRI
jgi:hypothetical protein